MINREALQQVLGIPPRPVSRYTIAHRDKLGLAQHMSFDEVMLDIWPQQPDHLGRTLCKNELEAIVLSLRITRKLRPRKRSKFRPLILNDNGQRIEDLEDYSDFMVAKGTPRQEADRIAVEMVMPYSPPKMKKRYSSATNSTDYMDMITSIGATMLLESGPYSDVPTTEQLIRGVTFYAKFFVPEEELEERKLKQQ